MKVCPQCGKSVDETDKRCSHCGHKLEKNKNLKYIIGILVVVVLVVIVGAFVGGVFNNGENTNTADHSASQVSTPVNNSTNSITATAQAKPELVIDYGTSIANLYNTIYLIENETKTAIEKQTYGTWSGNYLGYATVENKIIGVYLNTY